jgi:CHAT domain-containing protein
VVSSYTPTLTAILDLSEPTVRDDFKILTVAQPSTPYATPIPKTEEEIKRVQTIAGDDRIVSLTNEEATVERVLHGMRDTDWVHLACHGRQCTGDPMKSGLLLHDKILELSVIVKQALPRAELAFLSACQTATGDERIADESVHLAAGMFLAGYRGVIATMWSIKDSDAPKIAEDVYRRILKDRRPNRKEAAYALHDAVKRLRESGASFMSWVPFIHIGR